MESTTYGVLAIALTVAFGIGTWVAYTKRGLGAGLMGAGITVLPVAAWLTGTLRMFSEVGSAVGRWGSNLVLSPRVWVGIVLAVVGVLVFVAGRAVHARSGGAAPAPRERRPADPAAPPASLPASQPEPAGRRGKAAPAPVDDDLADIEAILKSRGIT
ncbi:hypothetical protein GCM10023340_35550 [Nocardioides marinquilinus]|uniref:Cellulose synthase n=1 Tax=Nocardioides marinquilinus TaxID=1210400 RepID=A0ABP9PWN4_9ACTN